MRSPVVLRVASAADVEAGAAVQRASWDEAYRGLMPDGPLDAFVDGVEERIAAWRWWIDGEHPPLLALDAAGAIVGFGSAGPNRDEDADVAEELYALYVRRTHWGTGLAHRLCAALLGDRPATVWVLAGNARARAFYAKAGFTPDGTHLFDTHYQVEEVRLVRPALSPAGRGTGHLDAERFASKCDIRGS